MLTSSWAKCYCVIHLLRAEGMVCKNWVQFKDRSQNFKKYIKRQYDRVPFQGCFGNCTSVFERLGEKYLWVRSKVWTKQVLECLVTKYTKKSDLTPLVILYLARPTSSLWVDNCYNDLCSQVTQDRLAQSQVKYKWTKSLVLLKMDLDFKHRKRSCFLFLQRFRVHVVAFRCFNCSGNKIHRVPFHCLWSRFLPTRWEKMVKHSTTTKLPTPVISQ